MNLDRSLNDAVLRWLANGQVGASSRAMALCACGIISADNHHPLDPADFNRCLLLVARIPEIREHFPRIAELSWQWKIIIENWDELEAIFLEEAGLGWEKSDRAELTYERMQRLLQQLPANPLLEKQALQRKKLMARPDGMSSKLLSLRRQLIDEMLCECGGVFILGPQFAHCDTCDRKLVVLTAKSHSYRAFRKAFPDRCLDPAKEPVA